MELLEDMTMVDYEVTTLKRDFNDQLEGIKRRHFRRCLDLSPKSHRPSSYWFDFSFGSSRKTLGFDSPRGRWPLSSQHELFPIWTKRPLGFHENVMHLLWSFMVSLWMKTGKWPLEHAIIINYLHQVNFICYLWTTNFFHSFSNFNDLTKFYLLGESTRACWSCDWRHASTCWCSHVVWVWS